MGLFDFLESKPSVPQADARRTVYLHRLDSLKDKVAAKEDQAEKEAIIYSFVEEVLRTYFNATAKSGVDVVAQIEASKTPKPAQARATALYKRLVQYKKMGMSLGHAEMQEFVADCRQIIESC